MKLSKLIPGCFKRRLGSTKLGQAYVVWRLGGGSFSQHGEDFIISGIFDGLGIKKPSYIDIGANHPFMLSNTALFYKRGSRGVNIEPNPLQFAEIRRCRREDTNIMAGIGAERSTMPFYVMSTDTLSTFSREKAEALRRGGAHKIVRVIQVEVLTLGNVINDYCMGVFPDFMSLDAEGLDEVILGSLKDCPSLPKVICSETSGNVPEICRILEPLGYMLFLDNGLNSIFVLRDLWEETIRAKRA